MQARRNSYVYKKKRVDDEAWLNLEIKSDKKKAREALNPDRDDDTQIPFDFNKSYVKSLNYLDELKAHKALEHGSAFPQDTTGSADDVESAISMVIRSFYSSRSPVNLYVMLAAVKYKSKNDILEALSVCGTVVRGNWVIKSKLTPYGPSAQVVRDTILDIVKDVGIVDRARLKSAVQQLDISKDITDHMLKEICKPTAGGWVLKLEDDTMFYQDYQDLAKKMGEEWMANRERVKVFRERYDGGVLVLEDAS